MKAPLFLAVGVAGERAGSYQLDALRLGRVLPGLALASLVAALALAGLFPLGAAWTKEEMITAAGHYAPWVAVLAALAGGLSAAYAARFHLAVFGRSKNTSDDSRVSGHWLERGPVYGLITGTLLLSVLWLPGARGVVSGWFGAEIPPFKAWELIFSLMLVVAGLALGGWFASRSAALRAPFLDWLGLPALGRKLVATPVARLARGLAVLDDRWDGVLVRACGSGAAAAMSLARTDDRAVDAGVRACARFGVWLADLNSRAGEWLFDELPEGLGRLSGWAGRYAGRLQSGMVHHYYSIVAVGFAAIMITFVMGALL